MHAIVTEQLLSCNTVFMLFRVPYLIVNKEEFYILVAFNVQQFSSRQQKHIVHPKQAIVIFKLSD